VDSNPRGKKMINLQTWIEKTVQAVRRICENKGAPCVGFSLVFFDPFTENDEEKWNYVVELAYDPQNPPEAEERERIQRCFEFISEGIRRIYGDPGAEESDTDTSGANPYRQ